MSAPAAMPRYDMYRLIHKGLRALMADTLTALGSLDCDDPIELADVLGRVRGLLDFCRSHLAHEDGFVHPAMEAREPGSAGEALSDHAEHEREIAGLEAAVAAVEAAPGGERAAAAHALYRGLAVFVGENLVHMDHEESHNNAVLWRRYRDDELVAIEQAIVASQPPEEQMVTIRWIVAAASPAERAGFLGAIRDAAPPEVFGAILDMVQAHLRPADRAKLARALSRPALAA